MQPKPDRENEALNQKKQQEPCAVYLRYRNPALSSLVRAELHGFSLAKRAKAEQRRDTLHASTALDASWGGLGINIPVGYTGVDDSSLRIG